mmetsp:Transcript_26425/g.23364  ORF Transcript_26425/g.23364 Transcript_26425/m.23364 type:complete len:172 (-) Transcript_26425:865-1380(-)
MVDAYAYNNTLNNSKLISTNYNEVQLSGGNFNDQKNKAMIALYRFSIVYNSTIDNNFLVNSSLFTLNNGFLIMKSNVFTNLELDSSSLFDSGEFVGTLFSKNTNKYERNQELEHLSLSCNPIFETLLNESYAHLESTGNGDVVYFYAVYQNTIEQILSNRNMMWFVDYSPQ